MTTDTSMKLVRMATVASFEIEQDNLYAALHALRLLEAQVRAVHQEVMEAIEADTDRETAVETWGKR